MVITMMELIPTAFSVHINVEHALIQQHNAHHVLEQIELLIALIMHACNIIFLVLQLLGWLFRYRSC